MYLSFYGLREYPFNITPDPQFLYLSQRHQEALDHLLYGIEHRKGFIQLVGEVGCGKTTLCRALLQRLPAQVRTALILNPVLTGAQLLRAILNDLGEHSRERDRLHLVERLNAYLLDQARQGVNVVVIIDEAQNLDPLVMEQVRLLSNLETDRLKLLQIILAGQPELKARLASEDLRQLRQRIMIRCELGPLSLEETVGYVRHRLTVAGAKGAPIGDDVIRGVHAHTGGIPRLVNVMCDKILLAGYAAGREPGPEELERVRQEME